MATRKPLAHNEREVAIKRLIEILSHMVTSVRIEWWEGTIKMLLNPPNPCNGEIMLEAIFRLTKKISHWQTNEIFALIGNITILNIDKETVLKSAMENSLSEPSLKKVLQVLSAAAAA